MTLSGGLTFCKNFSSLLLSVWAGKGFEDLEEKDHSINQLMNDEAVYRTPGLLTIVKNRQ